MRDDLILVKQWLLTGGNDALAFGHFSQGGRNTDSQAPNTHPRTRVIRQLNAALWVIITK